MEEKMGGIEVGEILTVLENAAVAFVEEVNAETEENIDVFLSK